MESFLIILIGGFILSIVIRVLINYYAGKESQHTHESNIIKHPKTYFNVGIALVIVILATALVVLVVPSASGDDIERLVGFLLILPLSLLGFYFIKLQRNWKIEVWEEGFTYTNIWGKSKNYNFSEIILRDTSKATDVMDKDGKTIMRMSYSLVNSDCLLETYNKWAKTNTRLKAKDANQLRANFYVRNLAITFLTIGIVASASIILIGIAVEDDPDLVPAAFFLGLIITTPILLIGLTLLLTYKVWKIEIINYMLIFRNFLGITKTYYLPETLLVHKTNAIELFHGRTRIVKIWIYLAGNVELLTRRLYMLDNKEIKILVNKLKDFVSGKNQTLTVAGEIGVLLDRLFLHDDEIQDYVKDFALYASSSGEYLYDELAMVEKSECLIKLISKKTKNLT